MKIKRGDLFYAELDGRGSEQNGMRPVLIIQNDIGNYFSPTVIVAVVTSRSKKQLPTHVDLGNCLAKKSKVFLEQIKTIDKQRLESYIGHIDCKTQEKIDKALQISVLSA